MAVSADALVTRAFRRLQAIDINEQPSASEMTHGLNLLEEVVDGMGSRGLITKTQILAGDTADDSDIVSGMVSTASLLIGMNVSGTGIPTGARVKEVLTNRTFRLTADATASGAATNLTFSFLPIEAQYEGALIAILAVRLSEDVGLPVSAKLNMDASDGMAAFLAGYFPDRKASFDRALAAPAGSWNITADQV